MKLWKWQKGRQEGTEYQKFPLWYFKIWKWGFDAYILKYEPKTILKLHTDPVKDGKHWRLNIKLKGSSYFYRKDRGHNTKIVNFFRPDIIPHELTVITKTYKLSFGFVKFN